MTGNGSLLRVLLFSDIRISNGSRSRNIPTYSLQSLKSRAHDSTSHYVGLLVDRSVGWSVPLCFSASFRLFNGREAPI